MKARLVLLGLASAVCAFGTYYYDDWIDNTDQGLLEDTSLWTANGSAIFGGYPYYTAFSSPGSFIHVPNVSGNPNDYEVNTTLRLASGGGTFISYLRASSNALASSGSGTGSYISVEIAVPSTYATGVAGAQLTIHQCASGTLSTLASQSVPVLDGSILRAVVWGTTLWIFQDNQQIYRGTVASTTGQPGFGGYGMASAAGGFSRVLIGHHDTVAPNAPIATGLRSSILPTQASLMWQGSTDDTNGIGVAGYNVSRNGTLLGFFAGAELDDTVSAATSYTYAISAVDFHGNVSTATSYSITTPPSTAVDPRRVGVFTTGSYWGGGGEQIDTLSGNLNFSLPLAQERGRTGWTVAPGLSYNSQNWRQDSGTNWELGSDVGFGYGWKVQIGSITPYYSSWPNPVDHYVYTDGTGAEYRLDQNPGGLGIWSSTQGIYVWFDANASVLHFNDGSFWLMGDVSSGAEQDAGTMYPTVIEDVSGNQVVVTYMAAPSVPGSLNNTSARIYQIQGNFAGGYGFFYNTDAVPHLTGMIMYGTSNEFTFGYASAALGPPFGTDSSYSGLTTTHLTSMTPASGEAPYEFTYDSAGASELMEVTFPWGGHLRWTYATANYAGSRSLREVANRYLQINATGSTEVGPYPYAFTHSDSGGTIGVVHADTTIADASGVGAKKWVFNSSSSTWSPGGAWQIGLASTFSQLTSATGTALTQDTYTWTQNSSSNPYIATKVSVSNPGVTGSQSAQTSQTLDVYGNVTDMKIYPFGSTTTPVKEYVSTYLTGSSYLSNYIFNRLVSTTVSPWGGTAITLVTNTYDTSGSTLACSTTYPCPTTEYDPTPPIPVAYRGLVAASVTPAKTTTNVYYTYGALYSSNGTDGSSLTNVVSSTTNYSAPDSMTTQSYSNSLSYDPWLGMTQTTGANGEQMYMTYDFYERPATATSPYGTYGTPTVTYTYSDSGTLPVWRSQVGPDGYTKTTLDGLGRVIKVERGPSSSSIQSETDTVYGPCACSPLAKIQQTSMPYTPGGTPVWTSYTYDGIGRTLTVQQPDGASTTTYSYLGNQTTVIDPLGTTTTGATGNWKQFTSDAEGNLTMVVEPDPASPTTATAATYYTYDWMNHVACVDMTRGGTAATLYTYTSGGVTCQTGYTSGTRQTRTFVYNNAGQITSATNPESGTVTYTYNSDNTLATKTDAKSQEAVYTYDTQKRLTELQWYPTGTGHTEDQCQRVTYTYGTDATTYTYNRLITTAYGSYSGTFYDANGNYGTCVSGANATTYAEYYSYNPAGGVTEKSFGVTRLNQDSSGTMVTNAAGIGVSYSYDSAGRLVQTSYPAIYSGYYMSAMTLTQTYDTMGRPNFLRDNSGDLGLNPAGNTSWASGVNYDAAGRMTSWQRYMATTSWDCEWDDAVNSSLTESMTYNANGQMTFRGFNTGYVYNCATVTHSNNGITYTFSATQNNGQITQASDTISGETIAYAYDALKRLVSATSAPISGSTPTAWTQTFGYDGFGNLTSKVLNSGTNSIPWSVDGTTNRFTGSGSSYDLNGNLLSGPGVTLTYDEANRVATAVTASGTERYLYAPDNKRIYRSAVSSTSDREEWTFYGAKGEKLGVFRWSDSTGTGDCYPCLLYPVSSDVWFAGRLIWDGREGTSPPSGATYQDRVGTNRADGSRFYPYGEEIGGYSTTPNDHVKFGTYQRDSFTMLDYADQRYYASSYGRFNTADPMASSASPKNPGSWNRYNYALDDPVNRNDPSGQNGAVICGLGPDDPCSAGLAGWDVPGANGYAGLNPCLQISDALFGGSVVCGMPAAPYQPPEFGSAPSPSCDISVSIGTLIEVNNENTLSYATNAPPDGQLGAYQTENGGVYLAVQIQGILSGVTDPNSWNIAQSAAAITISGTPLPPNGVAGNINDAPAPPFIYSIPGGTGWTDTPGVGANLQGEYKFFFTSSLTLNGTDVSCDVQWGFDVKNNGNTWSVAPWGTN